MPYSQNLVATTVSSFRCKISLNLHFNFFEGYTPLLSSFACMMECMIFDKKEGFIEINF